MCFAELLSFFSTYEVTGTYYLMYFVMLPDTSSYCDMPD
jgi:hypothetical protein